MNDSTLRGRSAVPVALCFTVALILQAVAVQPLEAQGWRWVSQGGGHFATGQGLAVEDNAGHVYMTGSFSQSASFGHVTLTGGPDLDAYLVKYTPEGDVLWGITVSGPSAINGAGTAIDNDSNIYLTGDFIGTATFENETLISNDRQSSFLAKYTSGGKLVWVRQMLASGGVLARQVAVDGEGNVVVSGRYSGEAHFGSLTINGIGMFVVKYSDAGNVTWVRQSSGSPTIVPYDLTVDDSGHIYAIGNYTGQATFDSAQLRMAIRDDIFLVKYSPSGNVLWARQAGGELWDDGRGVAVDAAGNIYITGAFYGEATFGTRTATSSGDRDVFLARYSPDGNVEWVATGGGPSFDIGYGVVIDASGVIAVAGRIISTAIFGDYVLAPEGQAIFVAGFDDRGGVLWVRDLPSPDGFLTSIAAAPAGDIVLCGAIQGNARFGHIPITSSGHTDAVLGRFRVTNNSPIARDDRAFVREGASVLIDVLANDVDPDGDALTLVSLTQPAAGAAYIEDGQVRLNAGGAGTFTFTYTLSDGRGGSAEASVIVLVRADNANTLPLAWDWASMAGGSSAEGVKLASSVAVDASGDTYITGHFRGAIFFGGTTLASADYDQVFVAKYSSRGVFEWVRSAPGSESSQGLGLALDSEANVYVTGSFRGISTFGTTTLTSRGGDDVFIAKYSPAGDPIWARRGGSTHNDTGSAIAVDPAGYVYVTGDFQGEADFGTRQLRTAGNTVFVVKYSPEGHVVWARSGGHISGVSVGLGIAVDHSGHSFVSGWFRNNLSFWPVQIDKGSGSDKDVFLLKLSPSGNPEWALSFGSESDFDYGHSVAADPAGNVYVTGTFGGSVDFGGTTLTASPQGGTFVAKYDPRGGLAWARHFLSSSTHEALGGNRGHAIALDPFDAVYVTGDFSGNITIGNTSFTSEWVVGYGGTDAFVVKYDSEGHLLWSGTAGGPGSVYPRGIAADAYGNVFVAGSVWNLPATFGSTTLSPVGANVFIARLSPITGTSADRPQHGGMTFAVSSPYPNPSRDRVMIPFSLAHPAEVQLEVYDTLGRRLLQWRGETLFAGQHETELNTSALASGVYLIRLRAGDSHGLVAITISR